MLALGQYFRTIDTKSMLMVLTDSADIAGLEGTLNSNELGGIFRFLG